MPGEPLSEHETIWSRTSGLLRGEVSESTFQVWLEPLKPAMLDGSVLVLEASDSIRSWVESRFADRIARAASRVAGEQVNVELVAPGKVTSIRQGSVDSSGTARIIPSAETPSPGPLMRASGLNPKYTFEQFVIGEGNRMAHAAALAVAEAPGLAYNPLFIYGPPGVGKTHLMHAVGNLIETHDTNRRIVYTTAEEFTNNFIRSIRTGEMDSFKDTYRAPDVLLIDDIQFLESKARTEEEFFHTFNAIRDMGAQLVIGSDRTPGDLESLETRLRERFGSGLVVDIDPPDLQTRTSILAMRVRRDGLADIQADTLVSIAERIRGNVRMLEGALIRVVAYASLTGQTINRDLVSEVLEQLYPHVHKGPEKLIGIESVKRLTAQAYGVSVNDIESKSRSRNVLWPRQVAMYLAREEARLPLPQIGEAFQGRNHSTVINACKRVEERIAADPAEALAIRSLTRKIRSDDRTA